MLGGRFQAGAIIALIVEVGAAANHFRAQFRQQCLDLAVKLALAVIAARAVVADIVGVLKLVGGNDPVADADLVR